MKCAALKDIPKNTPFAAVSVLLMVASFPAWSEDPDPNRRWQGDVEAGMVSTEGNTQAKSLKTAAKLIYQEDRWRHSGGFESFTAEQEDEGTAEKYYLEGKSAYSFTEFNYAFISANYTDDRFSEFDYQVSTSAGYGRLIIKTDNHRWDAEIGPGHRISKYREDSEYKSETIAHAATNYTWNISPTSRFEQNILVEAGDINTVTRSKTALIAQINSSFSMKLGYTVTYNQQLPEFAQNDDPDEEAEETPSHADKETTVSLLYAF
jgi:putative salt-induced outer membrane protein